jgi:hypothetical protein
VRALAVAAAAAVALAGCGGPATSDAVKVADTWVKAIQQGDDTAACKLMDAKAATIIASKYAPALKGKPCETVVNTYRHEVGKPTFDAIAAAGLEANGKVNNDRLGVFPKDKAHQYDIVLMHHVGGHWTVASTGIR